MRWTLDALCSIGRGRVRRAFCQRAAAMELVGHGVLIKTDRQGDAADPDARASGIGENEVP